MRIEELEEKNLHSLRNAQEGARHIRGVYRWLNKIYRAQTYTYGMRHMLEFMVPEPAAFYLWSLTKNQDATPPLPLLTPPNFGPHDLKEWNWYKRAVEYGAEGVQAPPAQFIYVSHTAAVAGTDRTWHAISHTIQVPDGYQAISGVYNVGRASAGDPGLGAGWRLLVHNRVEWGDKEDKTGVLDFDKPVIGQVPIGFRDWGNYSYVIAINLQCERTYDTFKK